METSKKFYWIKLKTDFFESPAIDFLLAQENGSEYVVLYQMLCCKTANNGGSLSTQIGEMIIPYDADKITRDTKYFSKDTVMVALELFKKLGLIYVDEGDCLRLSNTDTMIGSESASKEATKKRQYRLEHKADSTEKEKEAQEAEEITEDNQVDSVEDTTVDNTRDNTGDILGDKKGTKCPTEIRDKRIDIKEIHTPNGVCTKKAGKPATPAKKTYGNFNHVKLTDQEYEQILKEYPGDQTTEIIQILDDYIEMKGNYKVKSHYMAIRKWVIDAYKERKHKRILQAAMQTRKYGYNKALPDYLEQEHQQEKASAEDMNEIARMLQEMKTV